MIIASVLSYKIYTNSFIGADTQANDGIYTAYILPSHVTGNGRVSVKVNINNNDGSASVVVPVTRNKRSVVPNGTWILFILSSHI